MHRPAATFPPAAVHPTVQWSRTDDVILQLPACRLASGAAVAYQSSMTPLVQNGVHLPGRGREHRYSVKRVDCVGAGAVLVVPSGRYQRLTQERFALCEVKSEERASRRGQRYRVSLC